MRQSLRLLLVRLGSLFLLGVVGVAVMNPAMRLMFFVVAAIVASILAFFAKPQPARVTRIILAVGALAFAGLSYPEAGAWTKAYVQHRERASANVQASPPAKAEARE